MKKKRTGLKILLLLAALGLLAGVGVYLHLKKDALMEQVVERGITDTTEEKGMNIPETFQVYKNRLYCNSEKGFGYVDLETGKKEILTQKNIYDFIICDELIYYVDSSRALDRLFCKNLNDVAGKERLRTLRDIESYFFMDNEVIALRDLDDKHVIIKWGEDGSEQVLLEFGFDVIEPYNAQLCGYYEGKYIFFSQRGIYTVDGSTGEVQKVFSIESKGSVHWIPEGIRCAKDKVYIWAIAYDQSQQPFLFGDCYLEDSEMTGVWQLNLDNYEAERISDECYREMCMLQGELYGVEGEGFRIKKLNPVNIMKL